MALPLQSSQRVTSPVGIALAFLGMFVVGSLGVQLLRGLPRPSASVGATKGPEPVLAHPAALWSALGER
ncbi:conserved hypothetical protein [Cyanobium sp. PCC 7001]|uniref:hypothetical protein n=1 Tax=Cyanobium sp. PCC 7001 TaxID=180281 RepID=UPI0001805ACE|nr:hypothetical protein [Cyanobium sp. PCC 7001]EDY38953.1 conserved hypothetical protein [Cyanobium sp. PCC 7001]